MQRKQEHCKTGLMKCKREKLRGKAVVGKIGRQKTAVPYIALVEGVINERHVEITSQRRETSRALFKGWNEVSY